MMVSDSLQERARHMARWARVGVGAWGVVLLMGAGALGCGSDDAAARDMEAASKARTAAQESVGERQRFGNLSTQGLQVEKVDLNNDGKPDQFVYKTAQGVARIERDMNFDGQIDLWQYFDEKGELVEEEMDLDFDGQIDLVAYYKDGVIERKAMSVAFGNVFSIVKFYDKDGNLLRVERDEDNDGVTDVWEYYNKDGRRERIGWDTNGDGMPDKFDQLP